LNFLNKKRQVFSKICRFLNLGVHRFKLPQRSRPMRRFVGEARARLDGGGSFIGMPMLSAIG